MKPASTKHKGVLILILKLIVLSGIALVLLSGLARAAKHNKLLNKAVLRAAD